MINAVVYILCLFAGISGLSLLLGLHPFWVGDLSISHPYATGSFLLVSCGCALALTHQK